MWKRGWVDLIKKSGKWANGEEEENYTKNRTGEKECTSTRMYKFFESIGDGQ